MDSTQALAISGVVFGVAGTIYGAINHRRVISNCCGRRVELSLDIEPTTPKIREAPKDSSGESTKKMESGSSQN
jgi:hypothetical protein